MVIGVALILPLSLLASIHAQTMWTEDAADTLNSGLEDGEDFLFVHDATLGMHYLYTFHTAIEDVHKRNITGHWRSPDSGWEQELYSNEEIEKNLDKIYYLLLMMLQQFISQRRECSVHLKLDGLKEKRLNHSVQLLKGRYATTVIEKISNGCTINYTKEEIK